MDVLLGISPLLAVALGALLLMLAEAFGKPASEAGISPEGVVIDAGAGRTQELSLGASVVMFAGAIFSVAVWLVGPANIEGLNQVEPYLVIDRFTLFFSFALCL